MRYSVSHTGKSVAAVLVLWASGDKLIPKLENNNMTEQGHGNHWECVEDMNNVLQKNFYHQ